jgi:hypothetical protein
MPLTFELVDWVRKLCLHSVWVGTIQLVWIEQRGRGRWIYSLSLLELGCPSPGFGHQNSRLPGLWSLRHVLEVFWVWGAFGLRLRVTLLIFLLLNFSNWIMIKPWYWFTWFSSLQASYCGPSQLSITAWLSSFNKSSLFLSLAISYSYSSWFCRTLTNTYTSKFSQVQKGTCTKMIFISYLYWCYEE